MALVLATILALMLKYLVLSEGFLSPPVNLSVELLDFQAYVRWLPGPGSPAGTRYYLEFTDVENYSKEKWNQSADCSNITSTQCGQIFNHWLHFTALFVRVKAEWRDERSEWEITDHSFQPYTSSLLSPPHLTITADDKSISVNLSHPVQSVKGVLIKFLINLFRINSDKAPEHIAQNRTTRYSRFTKLPQGFYCITASAFYTATSKPNHNTTKCVSVHRQQPDVQEVHGRLSTYFQQNSIFGGSVWIWVAVCVSVFVLVLLGLAKIATCCYVSHVKMTHTPKVLLIMKGTRSDPTLKPEAPCVYSVLVIGSYNSRHEDMSDVAEYWGRLNVPNGSAEDPEAVWPVGDVDEDLPVCPDLYTTALKMEESDEYSSPEEIHGYGLTDKTLNSSGDLGLDWVPGTTLERTCQSAELENLLNSKLEEYEKKSKTEEQVQTCSFSYCYEGEEPFDEETDSLDSLGSCYLPRPNPQQMLDFMRF